MATAHRPAGPILELGGRTETLDGHTTLVMGVVNLSPDSRNAFTVADSPDQALSLARQYRRWGADLIDLGAQSSYYESRLLSPEQEWELMQPALHRLVADGFAVSVDTWRPEVAEAALAAGAILINDTGGLQDAAMVDVVAAAQAQAVLMYIEGRNPHDVGDLEIAPDKAARIAHRLRPRLESLAAVGITRLVIDPGIAINYPSDYGAYTRQQLEVIRRLADLRTLGRPILVPIPRKRETERVVAYITLALEYGADLIRVHDVEAACDLVRLFGRAASPSTVGS